MEVKLVMFKANGQRKDFPIVNPTTVIGRGEDCDLRAAVLSVSRGHCELSITGDAVKVKDLASSNGTYVNNRRINEVELKAGDRLVVGPIVFTVQINGQPEEIQAVKTQGQILAEQSKAGSEEAIELETEAGAQPDASALDETSLPGLAVEADEEFDPISALEALGEEAEQKEKEGEQKPPQQ